MIPLAAIPLKLLSAYQREESIILNNQQQTETVVEIRASLKFRAL